MVMGKNARREPGRTTRREYLNAIRRRYKKADRAAKTGILDDPSADGLPDLRLSPEVCHPPIELVIPVDSYSDSGFTRTP